MKTYKIWDDGKLVRAFVRKPKNPNARLLEPRTIQEAALGLKYYLPSPPEREQKGRKIGSQMPFVQAADGRRVTYRDARLLWEEGGFSEWVEEHGFPLTINLISYPSWAGVEDALSLDEWDASAP